MKYAILADIHANLEALEAVLIDARDQGCTHHVCLGDIVGNNASPSECVEIVRLMGMVCVKGNHDEYSSENGKLDGFNPSAARAIQWTRKHLSESDRAWLRGLKYVEQPGGFTVVHATLDRPETWGYIFDRTAAAASFRHQTTPVCFCGHTHVPVAFLRHGAIRGGTYSKFGMRKDTDYLINVGSVGQPRDGTHGATYAIYDPEEATVELRRIEYDIARTHQRIRDAGLPGRSA